MSLGLFVHHPLGSFVNNQDKNFQMVLESVIF